MTFKIFTPLFVTTTFEIFDAGKFHSTEISYNYKVHSVQGDSLLTKMFDVDMVTCRWLQSIHT